MKNTIQDAVSAIVTELAGHESPVVIEIPSDESRGDYTTNVALLLAKVLKTSPMRIAEEIAEKLEGSIDGLERVAVAEPGFINFRVSSACLVSTLKGPVYTSPVPDERLEYIENTQPNTNKPLHIGHLRNTALGEAIVHLRQAVGHKAKSVNINNDRGIHIIKAMYGYLLGGKEGNETAKVVNWDEVIVDWVKHADQWKTPQRTHEKSDYFVGKYYILGDQLEHGEEGNMFKTQAHLMLAAWEDGDPRVRALWEMMNTWFYKGFHETHARFLGIDPCEKQFEKEWFESEIYSAGKQLVLDNLDKKIFEKAEDGSIVAKLKDYALSDKIVIRKDGTSLYITQDLELIRMRSQEDHAALSAYVVASEQDLQFKQLFTIAEALGLGSRKSFLHISYGMVNLKSGEKMSSRLGTAINADDLMDMLKKKITDTFKIEDETLAEQIMLGALKYWMLRYNPKAQISFDLEESVNLGGNSGPYLQYAYARTQSILGKSQIPNLKSQEGDKQTTAGTAKLSLSDEEIGLLRKMLHFGEVIESAATEFSPSILCTYLYELAQLFNLFYQKQSILNAPEELKEVRLQLTKEVGETLQFGLGLLGIPTPEKM